MFSANLEVWVMKIYKIEGRTPADMFEISEYINSLPDDQRESAVEVLCMTWNFLAECMKNGSEYGGDSTEHLGFDEV